MRKTHRVEDVLGETKRFPTMLFPAIIWNSIGVDRARQPLREDETIRKGEYPVVWFLLHPKS